MMFHIGGLKPHSTALIPVIEIGKFFLISIVVAHANRKRIARDPLNLTAVNADGNFRARL